ncbi:MAG: hypothetical protein AAF989_07510 [Planctomycetota bacterium]
MAENIARFAGGGEVSVSDRILGKLARMTFGADGRLKPPFGNAPERLEVIPPAIDPAGEGEFRLGDEMPNSDRKREVSPWPPDFAVAF